MTMTAEAWVYLSAIPLVLAANELALRALERLRRRALERYFRELERIEREEGTA